MKVRNHAEWKAQMEIALDLIFEACENDWGLCCDCPFEEYCMAISEPRTIEVIELEPINLELYKETEDMMEGIPF